MRTRASGSCSPMNGDSLARWPRRSGGVVSSAWSRPVRRLGSRPPSECLSPREAGARDRASGVARLVDRRRRRAGTRPVSGSCLRAPAAGGGDAGLRRRGLAAVVVTRGAQPAGDGKVSTAGDAVGGCQGGGARTSRVAMPLQSIWTPMRRRTTGSPTSCCLQIGRLTSPSVPGRHVARLVPHVPRSANPDARACRRSIRSASPRKGPSIGSPSRPRAPRARSRRSGDCRTGHGAELCRRHGRARRAPWCRESASDASAPGRSSPLETASPGFILATALWRLPMALSRAMSPFARRWCPARPTACLPDTPPPIPVAFITAHCALLEVGRLKRGERVLIHAAAGGVGLAAVQIAQRIGAEIIATCSSQEKRPTSSRLAYTTC